MRDLPGVAILVKRSLPFIQRTVVRDNRGRFIVLEGTLNGKNITIIKIYAPPPLSPEFLTELQPLLLSPEADTLRVGGDFNAVMDPCMDRSRGQT